MWRWRRACGHGALLLPLQFADSRSRYLAHAPLLEARKIGLINASPLHMRALPRRERPRGIRRREAVKTGRR